MIVNDSLVLLNAVFDGVDRTPQLETPSLCFGFIGRDGWLKKLGQQLEEQLVGNRGIRVRML